MLGPCMLGPNFWSALRSLGRVCFFTLSFKLDIHLFLEQKYKYKSQSQITKPESKWRKRTWNVYTLPHLVLMPRMYAVSCASATQKSVWVHYRIACKQRVSRQCGKACKFSECLIGWKRNCTDYMHRNAFAWIVALITAETLLRWMCWHMLFKVTPFYHRQVI